MSIIECSNLTFQYAAQAAPALQDIDLTIEEGEFIALLGHNGCGKSTLARHINALLPLQRGRLFVAGMDASDRKSIWRLRRKAGMVFQNPDNQFVSSVVEDDVAFGLENYLVDREEIPGKVKAALTRVGMADFSQRLVHTLSGGQKQRAALAGVLALDPDILIFDEATAMLDPDGRHEVLEQIDGLHKRGKTILMITHYVEEAMRADRIVLMIKGRILADGTPRTVLSNEELLAETGLLPPEPVRVYLDLKKQGIYLPDCPLTEEELARMLCQLKQEI